MVPLQENARVVEFNGDHTFELSNPNSSEEVLNGLANTVLSLNHSPENEKHFITQITKCNPAVDRGRWLNLISRANLPIENRHHWDNVVFAIEKENHQSFLDALRKLSREEIARVAQELLDLSCFYGRPTIVFSLIKECAKEKVQLEFRENLMHSCREKKLDQLQSFLKSLQLEGFIQQELLNLLLQDVVEFACQKQDRSYFEVVSTLLSYGASSCSTDRSGQTVLHYASTLGDLNLVRLLVEKGAEWHSKCQKGTTPFQIAFQSGSDELREYYTKLLTLNISKEMQACIVSLLDASNALRVHDRASLSIAVGTKDHRALYDHLRTMDKASFEIAFNPLFDYFVKTNRAKSLSNLMSIGKGHKSRLPKRDKIFSLCEKGKRKCLKVLLKNGLRLNTKNSQGETLLLSVLHLMQKDPAQNQHLKPLAIMLIDAGADVKLEDLKGNQPLDLAYEINDYQIIRALRKNGALTISETEGYSLIPPDIKTIYKEKT